MLELIHAEQTVWKKLDSRQKKGRTLNSFPGFVRISDEQIKTCFLINYNKVVVRGKKTSSLFN